MNPVTRNEIRTFVGANAFFTRDNGINTQVMFASIVDATMFADMCRSAGVEIRWIGQNLNGFTTCLSLPEVDRRKH
jgi:hypothetical protein